MIKKWINKFIYKPNSTEIYWEKIISSIVVVCGFAVIVQFTNTRLARLKHERDTFKRYVVGVTTTEHNNIKGDLVVDYKYFFAGIQYSTSGSTKKWLSGKPNTHGGRYFVELAYVNPSNAEILFNYPVPDSISNSPDSGWRYMPGYKNESGQ